MVPNGARVNRCPLRLRYDVTRRMFRRRGNLHLVTSYLGGVTGRRAPGSSALRGYRRPFGRATFTEFVRFVRDAAFVAEGCTSERPATRVVPRQCALEYGGLSLP